mgnify:CR=1 FL=1
MKTTSRPLRVFLAALALLACLFGAGGDLKATLNADYDHALHATSQAINDLHLMKVGAQHDALVANFTLRNADDKRIKIHLQTSGSGLTELTIRIGLLGDEAQSRAIYDRIVKNL